MSRPALPDRFFFAVCDQLEERRIRDHSEKIFSRLDRQGTGVVTVEQFVEACLKVGCLSEACLKVGCLSEACLKVAFLRESCLKVGCLKEDEMGQDDTPRSPYQATDSFDPCISWGQIPL